MNTNINTDVPPMVEFLRGTMAQFVNKPAITYKKFKSEYRKAMGSSITNGYVVIGRFCWYAEIRLMMYEVMIEFTSEHNFTQEQWSNVYYPAQHNFRDPNVDYFDKNNPFKNIEK